MTSDFSIALTLGEKILTKELLRVVLIIIRYRELYVDLMTLIMQDFDVILGMDLLSKYNAIIHGHHKKVVFHLWIQKSLN